MPSQVLNLGNFGQSGFLPDIAPSLLPQTGFSYARNFRFNEGGRARVTDGYTNAFDTRGNDGDPFLIGNEESSLTFLYTWELSGENAVAVYDATAERMLFIENNSQGGLSTFNLSVRNDQTYLNSYIASGTPPVNHFTINSAGEIEIGFATAFSAGEVEEQAQAGREVSFVDNLNNVPAVDTTIASVAVNGTLLTITLNEPILDTTKFEESQFYSMRVADVYFHDNLARFKWDGTDALGVPIFNNEVEPPWEFVNDPIPKVQQMTNWPDGGIATQISSFGTVLVAVGYKNDDANFGFQGGNRTIAFSNPITDAGNLPEWDFENLDSQSQIIDLSLYTDGILVSAFESQGRLIVNSTTDVMAITDNGDGTYSATKLEIGGGVLTKRTSVAIPNGFFNIGNGQFYTHDTNSYQSVGHGLYSDSWFSSVDIERLDEVQVIYDPRLRSVWIKTPTSNSAQQIWIINLENNNTLSVLDDHQEVKYLEWSAEGTPAETVVWDNFPVDQWEEIPQNSWNEFPVIELGEYRNRVLGCGQREVYVHDFGPTYNGRPINAILEKSYFKLGANDSYGTFQFDRVVPWASGETGDMIDIRVGNAASVGAPTAHTSFKTYTIGMTEKLDFRRQAKWGSITFQCTTAGVELSGVEIKVNSANRR